MPKKAIEKRLEAAVVGLRVYPHARIVNGDDGELFALLDVKNDHRAKIAMLAYAGACEDDFPGLAKELISLCSTEG